MVAQFYIYGKSGKKLTYHCKTNYKTGAKTYYRNSKEIDVEEYNKALSYFNDHR